jgi:hypothetical protein
MMARSAIMERRAERAVTEPAAEITAPATA